FCTFGLRWRWRQRWTSPRVIAVVVLATLVYLAHLAAFGVLALSMFVLTVVEVARHRRGIGAAIVDLVGLVPAFPLFLLFMRHDGRLGKIGWNDAFGKLVAAAAPLRTYSLRLDLVAVVATAACVVIALLPSARASWRRDALPAIVVLFVMFLALPEVVFTSGSADARLVIPIVLFVLLSFFAIPGLAGPSMIVVGGLLLIATVRVGAIVSTWSQLDREIQGAVSLMDELPMNARVFQIWEQPEGHDAQKRAQSLRHVLQYGVIERHLQTPAMFAIEGQQPLVYRFPTGMELNAPPIPPAEIQTLRYA